MSNNDSDIVMSQELSDKNFSVCDWYVIEVTLQLYHSKRQKALQALSLCESWNILICCLDNSDFDLIDHCCHYCLAWICAREDHFEFHVEKSKRRFVLIKLKANDYILFRIQASKDCRHTHISYHSRWILAIFADVRTTTFHVVWVIFQAEFIVLLQAQEVLQRSRSSTILLSISSALELILQDSLLIDLSLSSSFLLIESWCRFDRERSISN